MTQTQFIKKNSTYYYYTNGTVNYIADYLGIVFSYRDEQYNLLRHGPYREIKPWLDNYRVGFLREKNYSEANRLYMLQGSYWDAEILNYVLVENSGKCELLYSHRSLQEVVRLHRRGRNFFD